MKKIILSFFIVFITVQVNCIEWNLTHQLISTTTIYDEQNKLESDLNYKPELSVDLFTFNNNLIDTEFSYDLNLNYKNTNNNDFKITEKLYRGWLRYSTSQAELRVGLQKINFGPAQILRSLQWFDNINPHDPTKTTEGVKAFLGRYYFLTNANIWLWGIWGKSEETSYEQFFTDDDSPEFGGRVQYPFKFCETAFSYHWSNNSYDNGEENRFGFDARWDFEIGLWTEFVVSHFTNTNYKFSKSITLGADYTLSVGNGIYVLAEYLKYSKMNSNLFDETTNSNNAALSFSYPLGLFDSFSSIISFNFNDNDLYNSFTYQRTYNYLSIYVNLFLNPDSNNNSSIYNDNSIQLLLKWDF
ncbi:MAG: hypothetical protein U9P73_07725 [Candidatus Cloacimonadota bacterium]|nr:hypothetical protein [Candidatus Cloacimonadota bacterium]